MSLARRGLPLATALLVALVPASGSRATARSLDPGVYVLRVPGASFEQLMAAPLAWGLARDGGAALMSAQNGVPTLLREACPASGEPASPNMCAGLRIETAQGGATSPTAINAAIRRTLLEAGRSSSHPAVFVVGEGTSAATRASGDELSPVIMALDEPGTVATVGPMRTLTSDSTRRVGVVTDFDVAAAILRALKRTVPSSLDASAIRIVDRSPPFALHAKHLANRRMTVPVQTAAGVYVTLAALFCAVLLALRRRVSGWVLRLGAFLALTVALLAVGLLLAGHLPTPTYGTVAPFVIGITVVGTLACFALRPRFGVLAVPAGVGAAALVALVGEAAVSWAAALTPFLGGSELDGGRFYGMPNVFIGLLLGSSLYVAQRMRVGPGVVLLCAGGLFAGLPGTGANLGGALTMFAAAGLWLGVRRWGRFGVKALAAAAGVLVGGMAMVLAAHRYLTSAPTHVTRFEESSGRSLSGIWHTVVDRLGVGIDLIARNPAALAPTLGTLVLLAVALRPPAPIRQAFERHNEWRDAMVVILLASVVAYLGNDSGPAAAGLGFGMALGGMLYVALAEEPGKIGGP